ncbi:MAG: hypothetical protein WC584_00935 [Candidatus Pacearchaeota archaeon]
MENKFLIFGVVSLVVLLSIAVVIKLNRTGDAINNEDLNKYRSEKIPQECRLSQGENLQSWKEHLGHHQDTLYCLDYYK